MNEAGVGLALRQTHEALVEHQVPHALVGGLAVSVRGEVRFTRDVDLAVTVASDEDMERLSLTLRVAGFHVAALVEHEERGRLSTVRLRSNSGMLVNLLAASSGIEPEVIARATKELVSGLLLPVASTEELLALNVLASTDRRPQDRVDGIGLLRLDPPPDLARVRANLALIRARAYHRGRDLDAVLEDWVRAARS